MKNKKLQYRFSILLVVFSVICFISSIITALVVREKQMEYLVWFFLAGIFLLLSILSLYLIIKFTQSKYYKKLIQSARQESIKKSKDKNIVETFFLSFESTNTESEFSRLLQQFKCESLDGGKLFYREGKSIYNKKKNSFDIFYLLNEGSRNSFDKCVETKKIKKHREKICEFLSLKNQEPPFINCVIVFQHNGLSDKEKDFYYNFTGLWEADLMKDRFVKNLCFTYSGIDKLTKHIYFFKPSRADGGTEVDLNYIITKELKIS